MDYGKAIKRPFSDLNKFCIGCLFLFIPLLVTLVLPKLGGILFIIGGIFLAGYGYRCVTSTFKKEEKLPEYRHIGNMFVKGILYYVINIIYSIPLLIVTIIIFGKLLALGILQPNNQLIAQQMSTALASIGGWIVLFIVLALLTSYVSLGGIINFAYHKKFSAGIKFKEVFNKVFTKKYFVVWILAIIWVIVLSIIGGALSAATKSTIILPLVFNSIVGFAAMVTSLTLIAQEWSFIKK